MKKFRRIEFQSITFKTPNYQLLYEYYLTKLKNEGIAVLESN